MPSAFCPRCGNQRTGEFRYCRSCGFDFDADQAAPPPTLASQPAGDTASKGTPEKKSGSGVVKVVIGVLVVIILGLGATYFRDFGTLPIPNGLGGGPSVSDLPPEGVVWFGPTFDPSSFAMSKRTTSGAVGGTIAFVGRLRNAGTGIQVRLTIAGVQTTVPSDGIPDGSEVAGGTLNLLVAGPMKVEIVDVGGNVLATGSFTVVP